MREFIAFCFIYALSFNGIGAQTNSFALGRMYTYAVHGDVNSFMSPPGFPSDNLEETASAQHFLKVTAVGKNMLLIQPQDFRIFEYEKRNGANRELKMSDRIRSFLESPMEVTMDGLGQPVSMKVQANLPEWALNLKKTQVSRFTFLGNSNTASQSMNSITQAHPTSQQYSVQERSILGQCPVTYDMQHIVFPTESQHNPVYVDHTLRFKRSGMPQHDDFLESWNYNAWLKDPGHTPVENDFDWISQQIAQEFKNGIPMSWHPYENEVKPTRHPETENFWELLRLCETGSKLYGFRKTTDLQHCQTNFGNLEPTSPRTGVAEMQIMACGKHAKNVSMLEMSHKMLREGSQRDVDSMMLVDISYARTMQYHGIPGPVQQVTDFTYKPARHGLHFGNYTKPKPNFGNPTHNATTETSRLRMYQTCLERNGVMRSKFVPRDSNSNRYSRLNVQWNLRKQKVYPVAYFLPTSAHDVATAVKCGLQTRIHVVPNSGGHSYESIGWGTNHTLVVDFRNMQKMSVEGSGANAVGLVEPGALLGHVFAYFWENGGYGIPLGSCLTVGMGGHAIGGGVGLFSAHYGLAIDNAVEFEMVDGRGRIVVANERQNSDLFWALRGSGPGYIGIVTKFKFKLFDATKMKITFVRMSYAVKDFVPTYLALQNMIRWSKVNEPIYVNIFLAGDGLVSSNPEVGGGITFGFVHIQDPKIQPKGNSTFLKILFETFPPPVSSSTTFPNFIQFVDLTGNSPITVKPPNPFQNQTSILSPADLVLRTRAFRPQPDAERIAFLKSLRKENAALRYFKAKSFFIKRFFTMAQLQQVAQVLQRIPNRNIWILCGTEIGAIQKFRKNETAFVHRDSLLVITINYEGSSDPEQVDEGIKYLYELWNAMQFLDGGESYQNSPDLDIPDNHVRYYGQNLNRLIQQKTKWDPTNYFVTQLSLPVNSTRSNG